MADIATLGFDIDTSQLTRANRELNTFVSNAGKAEKAADKFGASASSAGNSVAASMTRAANAAQGAAAVLAAGAATNAAAAVRAAAAQTAAAGAARAGAAATNAAAAANNNHAQSATRATSATSGLSVAFLGLNASTLISTAAIIAGATAVGKAMDAYTQLQNTLKIAGLAGNEMVAVQDRLFAAANRNGVAIDEVTQFFRRMSITQKEVGAGNLDMVKMVDVVTAALRVQGTSAKAASGALLQLSQSFGSGRVKAEEFNSVQEGALPVLQAAANGITRFGGSISKLRAEVIAGTVTSKEFFEGILRGGADLEQLAATTKLTLGGALTAVYNSFVALVGQMDNASNASTTLSNALQSVSKWLDSLAKDPEFLSGVRAAIDALKDSLRGLLYIYSAIAHLGAQQGFAANASKLTDVEGKISALEAKQAQIQAELNKEVNIDDETQKKFGKDLAIVNGQLFQQIKLRDELRTKISHPTPLSSAAMPTNPYDIPAIESTSPFDPISNKRTAGGSSTTSKKNALSDAYRKIQLNAQQLIETLKLEEQQLGRTEEETNRLTYRMDLYNKVQDANIPLTKSVTEWIEKMAAAQADAKTSLDVSKFVRANTVATKEYIRQQQVEYDTIGMSREAATAYRKEQQALADATSKGQKVSEEQAATIHANALAYAAAEEKVTSYREALDFAKEIAKGFFSDMREGLINGQSLWESFGTAAINVLNRIASKVTDMTIDGVFAMAFGNGGTPGSRFMSGFGGLGAGLESGWARFSDWSGLSGTPAGGFSDVGALMAAKGLGDSGIFGTGISGGTALGALGGLASAGMGFMRGGTGGTIQGISGLLGAGASFIPGIGPFLGPAIGILGGLLGGLFGDQPKAPPKIESYGSLTWDAANKGFQNGGWENNGGPSLTGQMAEIGKSMTAFFKAAGGITDYGKLYGVAQSTFQQGDFKSATSYIINPDGTRKQWGQGDNPNMPQATGNAMLMSLVGGGVNISPNLRQGVDQWLSKNGEIVHQVTPEELTKAVQDIGIFDAAVARFGRDVPAAEDALKAVNDSFDQLIDTANEYQLAAEEVAKVEAERLRQTQKLGDEFKYNISQGLLAFDNPLQAALNELDKQREADLATNQVFLKEIQGYEDQKTAIERLYLERRNKMTEDFNNSALNGQSQIFKSLEDLIKQYLPGGNLAGESPAAQLAGLQAAYEQNKAAAFANPMNEQIVSEFIQSSAALAEYARDFFANDTRFVDQRDKLIADAQALQALNGGSGVVVNGQTTAVASDTQFEQLMRTVELLTTQLAASQNEVTRLVQLLDRYVSNS